MIPILKDYYQPGYLPDPKPGAIPPYLPNVNLAIRRELFEEINGYDEACSAGEDADLCVRAARAGWSQFFDSSACTYHEPRPHLRALIRQWIWYAQGGSHFFFKHQKKRLEIYLNLELTPKMYRYRRVLELDWFPFPTILFISAFPLCHVIALLILIGLATGYQMPALLFLLFSLVFLGYFFHRSSLKNLSWKELSLYLVIAYLINSTCILASFLAGLKKGRLFFYPGI